MSNVLVGLSTTLVEQPIRYTWDKNRGASTIRTFTGTEAQITAQEQTYRFSGWNTEVVKGPVWKLTATLSADERDGGAENDTPTNTWELFANVAEKDILSSNISVVTGLSSAHKMYLRDVLDGKVEVKGFDCSTTAKTPSEIVGTANTISLFKAICAGMKSRRLNVPTLRHSMTASQDYQFASATTGVDAIYSRAAMATANSIPNWIYNNMVADPGTNPATRTDGIEVYYGWHKHYPQIQVSAYGKSQITVEWEYGEWSTLLYPTYY